MTTENKKNMYKAVVETLRGMKTYESDDLLKLVKLIEEEELRERTTVTLRKVKK